MLGAEGVVNMATQYRLNALVRLLRTKKYSYTTPILVAILHTQIPVCANLRLHLEQETCKSYTR